LLKKLNPEHKLIALAMSLGKNMDEISETTGRSRSALYNLKVDPLFCAKVDELTETFLSANIAEVSKIRNEIVEMLPEAKQVLADCMAQDRNWNVRKDAAISVLNYAGLKPSTDINLRDERVPHLSINDPEYTGINKAVSEEDGDLLLDGEEEAE